MDPTSGHIGQRRRDNILFDGGNDELPTLPCRLHVQKVFESARASTQTGRWVIIDGCVKLYLSSTCEAGDQVIVAAAWVRDVTPASDD